MSGYRASSLLTVSRSRHFRCTRVPRTSYISDLIAYRCSLTDRLPPSSSSGLVFELPNGETGRHGLCPRVPAGGLSSSGALLARPGPPAVQSSDLFLVETRHARSQRWVRRLLLRTSFVHTYFRTGPCAPAKSPAVPRCLDMSVSLAETRTRRRAGRPDHGNRPTHRQRMVPFV